MQATAHSSLAMETQLPSQVSLQHTSSTPQTQASQSASAQPGLRSRASQHGPGVGVGAGGRVGSGSHGQSLAHSSRLRAIDTQVASQRLLQHVGSTPHTQLVQVPSLQLGPA
jgi:hypothetical protein